MSGRHPWLRGWVQHTQLRGDQHRPHPVADAELAGVPATGARVRLPYAMFYDVEGGSITAVRAYFPITVLVQRLQEAAT